MSQFRYSWRLRVEFLRCMKKKEGIKRIKNVYEKTSLLRLGILTSLNNSHPPRLGHFSNWKLPSWRMEKRRDESGRICGLRFRVFGTVWKRLQEPVGLPFLFGFFFSFLRYLRGILWLFCKAPPGWAWCSQKNPADRCLQLRWLNSESWYPRSVALYHQ